MYGFYIQCLKNLLVLRVPFIRFPYKVPSKGGSFGPPVGGLGFEDWGSDFAGRSFGCRVSGVYGSPKTGLG